LTQIQETTDFNEAHICKILTDILKAILYCHNHNIVHRDIKAENILF
jgi:calcium-dependent protein kinase